MLSVLVFFNVRVSARSQGHAPWQYKGIIRASCRDKFNHFMLGNRSKSVESQRKAVQIHVHEFALRCKMFGRQYLTFVFDNTRDSRLQSSSMDASSVNPNSIKRCVTLLLNSANPSCETTCLGYSHSASVQDAAQVREYFEMCLKAAEQQRSEDVVGIAAFLRLWVPSLLFSTIM